MMDGPRIIERDISSLRPYQRNARTHSKKQIKQIATSIQRLPPRYRSDEDIGSEPDLT